MYADDLVLICETKKEARQRFVAWRNAVESKGLKVSISKMKVMRCAWDVVPMEAAVDPCSVWKEGGYELNPLHNMWLLGTWAMFRSARKFGKSGTGFYVPSCRAGGRKATDEFHFKDVKLECVCIFR